MRALARRANPWGAIAVASSLLAGCGGGGGGGGAGKPNASGDPLIVLSGPTGRLSRTLDEANLDKGATPPPFLPAIVTTTNHWMRLEFPFAVPRDDLHSEFF